MNYQQKQVYKKAKYHTRIMLEYGGPFFYGIKKIKKSVFKGVFHYGYGIYELKPNKHQ